METAPLKSFATWARTSLIREVTARIAVVLAPASPERVEQPKAVEALEKAVTAAGGGDKGKAAVADKVAYTWFNRIIALRFMDANGYTGVGVVSPQAGVANGQPEILAEAKRGNIDTEVVGGKTREMVTALLNGTRRSDDAQGEAYALLLADYCRYWNRAMPFMFEREGDFTELLIPANLLADDSVPSRAVKVLTKDVCQDVEVIGWLYQFYISERKDEVFVGFKKNKKAGADEIPAATQLFTPHWIVRYLIENSLGRLWMLNHPESSLVDQMDYYIAPVDEETDFLKVSRVEELKVCDPACGSGHMLTYAFDLLYTIYEEEGYAPGDIPGLILTNNLYGVEIDSRAGALAAFALTMKARAKQRTFFNKRVEPNVRVLDPIHFTPDEIDLLRTRGGDRHGESAFWNQFEHANTLGSLIQPDAQLTARLGRHLSTLDDSGDILLADELDRAEQVIEQAEYLSPRYAVVVANPPYMGSRHMDPGLAALAGERYPVTRTDMFSMFIERILSLIAPAGAYGIMCPNTWMYINAHEGLRKILLTKSALASLIELPLGGFKGATVQICAFAGTKLTVDHSTVFVRLAQLPGAESVMVAGVREAVTKADSPLRYLARGRSFLQISGTPLAYWLPRSLQDALAGGTSIADVVSFPTSPHKTGDNGTYLRRWWEVTHADVGVTSRWVPYAKGGGARRWYGLTTDVVDWSPSALRYYSQNSSSSQMRRDPGAPEGITYSMLTSSTNTFRTLGQGYAFDMGGPGFLAAKLTVEQVLAVVNSDMARLVLAALNPTLNLQVREVKQIPVPEFGPEEARSLHDLAGAAIAIAKNDWNQAETALDFARPPVLESSPGNLREAAVRQVGQAERAVAELTAIERDINALVWSAAGVEPEHAGPEGRRALITANFANEYGPGKSLEMYRELATQGLISGLTSFAVGCMFGRYSLDEPGLILADQGATVQDYLVKVPSPTFAPDRDNVIPIVDGDWFEDDVVARFRSFLRVAFGEQHFEENLRFVAESLGVKDIRDYFVRSFYKDHVQRYKKRPIYWLFSSPKGSFNALIYMHRYTPSTVSTVLNEYLREFTAKLSSSLQQQERLAAGGGTPRQQAAAQKEADRLRKVLLELKEYEHDVLYPLASRQLAIDLDDGVKANYPKFGAALKRIPGLEASDE